MAGFSPLNNPLSRSMGGGSPLGVSADLGMGDQLAEQAAQQIIARRKKLVQTPGPAAFGMANGFGVQGNPGGNPGAGAGMLGMGGF